MGTSMGDNKMSKPSDDKRWTLWTLRSQRRHYFDSSVTLNEWKADPNDDERASGGLTVTNAGTGSVPLEWLRRIGDASPCPYAATDVDCRGIGTVDVVLSYRVDGANRIDVVQHCKGSATIGVTIAVIKYGRNVMTRDLQVPGGGARRRILRVKLNGMCVSVHCPMSDDGNRAAATEPVGNDYCGSVDIGAIFDLRSDVVRNRFRLLGGVRVSAGGSVVIRSMREYLTCGTGQADPRVVQLEDGTPIVQGNRIWIAMTTRGYERVEDSCQGVYEFDLNTYDLRLVSVIAFRPSADDLIDGWDASGTDRQWHAAAILFDEHANRWRFTVTSHGDDHALWQGELPHDPRRGGFIEAKARRMNYPASGNEEDSHVVYDAGSKSWLMIYVRMDRQLRKYLTFLAQADTWDGIYRDVAGPGDAQTGPLLQRANGHWLVFAGLWNDEPDDAKFVALDPDCGLRKMGQLHVDHEPDGRSVWPAIVPVTAAGDGSQLMLSFNRNPTLGQTPTGRYSYGDLLVYRHEHDEDEQ